ncbi:hypothetical protein GUJ93_ZPchr0191g16373 [Zizania palustris]|uniref:Protein kinase domain-containing protein n=2 Tax=Zizania palustris TaxID=103762 RepID=A0A8J5SW44_ZIZPA|nr:hypothetical protein GUJ93_ZPchr0191g16373 [Zizania palustris]
MMASGTGAQSTATAEPSDWKVAALDRFLQLSDIKEEEEDEYICADKFDLTSMDIKLEEHLAAKALGKRDGEPEGPKAAWEIDLSSLYIQRAVAHGVHGTLFRAKYYDQDVAVKQLNWGEDGYSTPEEIAHLRKSLEEVAAVWQNLDHPNITKFIGVSMGTSNLMIPPSDDDARNNGDMDVPPPDRACCVVVEFLTGGTLKGHLIKHMDSKLPYKEVVRFALAMARGLSRLHSRNIVHRDVKTENMLLDGELNLKIADFGVARLEQQDPREMTGTTGTLGYMAPEVLNGKPYNRSCDVYSFGICLWEMYCCDMPYADLAFTDASSAIVHQDLRPKIPGCCPSAMARIMRRCWHADPTKRPDMAEVVRLLEALDTSKGGGMLPEDRKMPGCFCLFRRRHGP